MTIELLMFNCTQTECLQRIVAATERFINAKTLFSNAIENSKEEVKQKRAQGGCLGTKSR